MRPLLLLPEMFLFAGGLAVLLAGSFLPRDRQWVARLGAAVAVLASMVAAAVQLAAGPQLAFEGTFAVDTATGVARLAAGAGTLLVLAMASDELAATPRESEACALLLWSTTGTVALAGAHDLLVVIVAFLLATIPLYALIGLTRTPAGTEAAMKTYLLAALFGTVLMLGVTILYAVAGTSLYSDLRAGLAAAPVAAVAGGGVAVLAALLFKSGGVPGHFWVPDAAEGAPATVAAFLTTVPKVGALVAAYRLVALLPDTVAWTWFVGLLAVASMVLGNLAAYWQHDPRRLLGWSTVGQVGFLLVPVAVAGNSPLALPSLLFYLAAYTVTNIAAFAVTGAFPDRRDLAAYRGMAHERPWLATALVIALLGLVGTPPLGIFVGKLTTATAAWDSGAPALTIAVLATTVLSLFYYLRWIAPSFATSEHGVPRRPGEGVGAWSSGVAVLAATVSVILGVAAGLVWDVVNGAVVP